MFQSRQGQVDSAQLPPCENCLSQHSKRANWKRCLDNFSEIPDPGDHGWMLDEDGILNINWMTGAPAPEAGLQLLSACRLSNEKTILSKKKISQILIFTIFFFFFF